MEKFYSKSSDELLKRFNVCPKDGMSDEKVKKSLSESGYNELKEKKKKGPFAVFVEQFKDLLVIILIFAGIISIITGEIESTIVIFAVIIMNAILGTVQHFKAEKSLNSLKALSAPSAKVMRNGVKIEIHSKEIVPGDIVLLEAGDLVVADGRIIENYSLQVNESSLTGESESVNKTSETITRDELALGDQKNMVFSSSLVTYGRAKVLVTATGMNTELGKIATLLDQTQDKETPLQKSLDDFGKKLALAILAVCVLVFCLSLYRGTKILDALLFAVALAVAAIPEALSSIVTIVLAMGTQKMAHENAIIKELKAVEGLGCVSIICSDKTGTLTQNKMTTRTVFIDNKLIESDDLDPDNGLHKSILRASILCNDSTSINGVEIGDPTEVAFVNLGHIHSIKENDLRHMYPRLREVPFDSNRKLMSTLHNIDNKFVMYTKGAFDVLLNRITHIKTTDGVHAITENDRKMIVDSNRSLSENGLRVLAFAYKELETEKELTFDDEHGYTFLGLISMIDPPRIESADAVRDCITACIKPIMITGDHKITATAIARQIGILQEGDMSIEGTELDKMSEEELHEKLPHISVYARVSPEHKIRIVNAWQDKGKIVAMTGDGVNDAPALKKADIGIAMGITGTEVSKDAASMILTDDNFATIVKAVSNGRNVYGNIKNSIKFLLSGNMSGILSVLYASIAALPAPFAAVHLLFINLLTDSLPAIAIGLEKARKDVLKECPRDSKESILTKDFMVQIGLGGLLIGIFTMAAFYTGYGTGKNTDAAMTMAFSTLCMARLFHGFNCRGKYSIFKLGVFSNPASWYAFITGMLLLNAVLFIPAMHSLFKIADLTAAQFGLIYLFAFIPTAIIQLMRIIRYDILKENS